MPTYEDQAGMFFDSEGQQALNNVRVTQDDALALKQALDEMADLRRRVEPDLASPVGDQLYAGWASMLQKQGNNQGAEVLRQLARGHMRQQALAEDKSVADMPWYNKLAELGTATLTEFGDVLSGGTTTTAAGYVADLLSDTMFDPAETRERMAPGSTRIDPMTGKRVFGQDMEGAEGFQKARESMLSSVASQWGGEGVFGEGELRIGNTRIGLGRAVDVARIAGFISGAKLTGAFGNKAFAAGALRSGRMPFISRTLGRLLGGGTGAGTFTQRVFRSAHNFGATNGLLGLTRAVNGAVQAEQRGESFIDAWHEGLHGLPTEVLSGYLTGGLMPFFAGFGQFAGRRLGGVAGKNIGKSFADIWGTVGKAKAFQAKAGQMIGGGVEFLPMGMLPDLHDPSNPFGVAQNFLDLFSDDDKTRKNALGEFLGFFLDGMIIKGGARGAVFERTRADKYEAQVRRHEAKMGLRKAEEIRAKIAAKKATREEKRLLKTWFMEKMGIKPSRVTPVQAEALRRLLMDRVDAQSAAQDAETVQDILRLALLADVADKARGFEGPSILELLQKYSEVQVGPPGKEGDILAIEADIERVKEAMAADDTAPAPDRRQRLLNRTWWQRKAKQSPDSNEARLNELHEKLAEALGQDPAKIRELAVESGHLFDALRLNNEVAKRLKEVLDMGDTPERLEAFEDLIRDPNVRQLVWEDNPVFRGGEAGSGLLNNEKAGRALRVALEGLRVNQEQMLDRKATLDAVGDALQSEAFAEGLGQGRERLRQAFKDTEKQVKAEQKKARERAAKRKARAADRKKGKKAEKRLARAKKGEAVDAAKDLRGKADERRKQGKPKNAKAYDRVAKMVEERGEELRKTAEEEGLAGLMKTPGIGEKTGRLLLKKWGLPEKGAIERSAQEGRIARRKERRQTEEDRRIEEAIDPDSGLVYGRRAKEFIEQHQRSGKGQILYGDLGNLKLANTVGGDVAGDALIREAGRVLLDLAEASPDVKTVRLGRRSGDKAVGALRLREGGDEFIVLAKSMAGGKRFLKEASVVLTEIQVGRQSIPVVFDWGMGSTLKSAEAAMKAAKKGRKEAADIGTREEVARAAAEEPGEGEAVRPKATPPGRPKKGKIARPKKAPKAKEEPAEEPKAEEKPAEEKPAEEPKAKPKKRTKGDVLKEIQRELDLRPTETGRKMPAAVKGMSLPELESFRRRLIIQRKHAIEEAEADEQARQQALLDLENQSARSEASRAPSESPERRARESAARGRRAARGSRRRTSDPSERVGWLEGTPEEVEARRNESKDMEKEIYSEIETATRHEASPDNIEMLRETLEKTEAMLDRARKATDAKPEDEIYIAREKMLRKARDDVRRYISERQVELAKNRSSTPETSTSMSFDGPSSDVVTRVEQYAAEAEARFEKYEATRKKTKDMNATERRSHAQWRAFIKEARQIKALVERAVGGDKEHKVRRVRPGQEIPIPRQGDWWIVKMADGKYVEGVVLDEGRALKSLGRRIRIGRPDGSVERVRVGDIVDATPSTIADLPLEELREAGGEKQLMQLARRAREVHTGGEKGVEITTGGLLNLLDATNPDHVRRVKTEKGLGTEKDSDRRQSRLLDGDWDGEYEVPDTQATKARTALRKQEREEGLSEDELTGGKSPEALKKTGDVNEAMDAEAKMRRHRWRNGDMRPDDYELESWSLFVDPSERRTFEAKPKTHAEVQQEVQGKTLGKERRKRGEAELLPDTDDLSDAFLLEHGTTVSCDPRKITFDPKDPKARAKWLEDAKRRGEEGDVQAFLDAHRYEQLMLDMATSRAKYEAQERAEHQLARRRVGLVLEHPKNVDDLKVGDSVMLRVRFYNDMGHVRRGRTFVGTLQENGNWRITEMRSLKEQKQWLEDRGIDEDPKDFHAKQREVSKQIRNQEQNLQEGSEKYTVTRDRIEQAGNMLLACAAGDQGARSTIRRYQPEVLDLIDAWVNDNPIPSGPSARRKWENSFRAWMTAPSESVRNSQTLVKGLRMKAEEGPAVEDVDAGEVAKDMVDPASIRISGIEGKKGDERPSTHKMDVESKAFYEASDGGIMFHLAHEALRHGLDPITRFPIRKDSKGVWKAVDPKYRGQGVILGDMLGSIWGGLRGPAGRDLWKTGMGVVATPFHVMRGVADLGTNAVRHFAWEPIRTFLFEPHRIGKVLPFQSAKEGGSLFNDLHDWGKRVERAIADPTNGNMVRRELNRHVAKMNAVPTRVIEGLRRFVNELTVEQQLQAIIDYDGGKSTHHFLEAYHEMAMEVGREAVRLGLLQEGQFRKHGGKWIPYHRWLWHPDAAKETLRKQEKQINEARAGIRHLRAMTEAERPKDWEAQIEALDKVIDLGKRRVDGIKQTMGKMRWWLKDRPQVGDHPLGRIDVTQVKKFKPYARTRTFKNIQEAIDKGLDVREPWRLLMEGLTTEFEAVERTKFFRSLSSKGDLIRDAELAPRDWIEVTGEHVTRDPVWQHLQGKKIDPYLMDLLEANEPTQGALTQLYEGMHSAIKMGLTMYNPGNWMTQLIGNPLIMVGEGVGMLRMFQLYAQGLAASYGLGSFGKNIDLWRKKNWVDQPTDADREFLRYVQRHSGIDIFKESGVAGWRAYIEAISALNRGEGIEGLKGLRRGSHETVKMLASAFRRLDAGARIGLYTFLREKGMSDAEATDRVNKNFDLMHVNSFARAARKGHVKLGKLNLPLPLLGDSFISIKAALSRNFWKMASGSAYSYMNWMLFSQLWNGVAGNILGMDDDEVQGRLEASTPAFNPITHWMDSNSSLLMGEGAVNFSRWMPWEPAADFIPGVKNLLLGGRDQFGQTAPDAIRSAFLGGRNVMAGPGIEYALDRDRYGRPVQDRYQEPGLFGFTGLSRVYMDNGIIPAALSGLRLGGPGQPAMTFGRFTPGVVAAATNTYRKVENADRYYQVINETADPRDVKVRHRTGWEVLSDILGVRINTPNVLRREIEKASTHPGTRKTAFGRRLTFGLDPSSEAGKAARKSISEEAALRQVERGYRLWGEAVDWRNNEDAREDIEGRWKRWMGSKDRLTSALRGLAVVGAYDKLYEVLGILESSGLLMEVFPPTEPVGRPDVKKILGSR